MNENLKRIHENLKLQSKLREVGFCGIKGPTGPTGPRGPVTISIGTTTTSDPGTNASVTNSGTPENLILDFTIPRGNTGATGETGPTGPTGPTLSTFGRKYNTATTTISLTPNTAQVVTLNSTGPSQNITTTTADTLVITESGQYLVEYYFSGSSSVNADLTVEVTQNDTSIGSSVIKKSVTANAVTDFFGSTINNFTEGDEINLSIQSTATATVTPSNGSNAYLNIIRIA